MDRAPRSEVVDLGKRRALGQRQTASLFWPTSAFGDGSGGLDAIHHGHLHIRGAIDKLSLSNQVGF